MRTYSTTDLLKIGWGNLWTSLGGPKDGAEMVFFKIQEEYKTPPISIYYSLEHLLFLLTTPFPSVAERPLDLELALHFSFLSGDPSCKKNSEKSVDFMHEILRGKNIQAKAITYASDLIHSLALNSDERTLDQKFMFDIVRSPLGQIPSVFWNLERRLRYEFTSEDEYVMRRKEECREYLESPEIYLTKPFSKAYKDAAQKNLRSLFKSFDQSPHP